MKKSLVVLTALTAVGLCTSAAMAENRAGAFNLTPVIGGYHYDGTQAIDVNLLYGLKAGYNITDRFGMEALLNFVHTKEWLNNKKNSNTMDMVNYRLELLYHLFPQSSVVPFVAIGGGGIRSYFNAHDYDDSALFSYGLGAKMALSENVALRADARMMSVFWEPAVVYNYEYTLGLNFQFGGTSKTVKAAEPAPAPKAVEPPPAPKAVEPPPAPPAPPVPTSSLTVSPAAVDKGNPATLNWSSANTSACSITPSIGAVATTGSMSVTPAETTAYALSCSGAGGSTASTISLTVTQPAPPAPAPPLDSDKDGVPDYLDKCPNTPAGVEVDKYGCPLAIAVAIEKYCSKPAVVHVEFDFDKATIKTKYDSDLNVLGDFLKQFISAKGEISGHSDSKGTNKYNQKLSERRAVNVKKYLVEKYGIDSKRITTEGYGELKPVADNKTKEGRAKNRRIETNFTCD